MMSFEGGRGDFTTISLENNKKKVPRRILHFSDGILEEYSTDEEEVSEKPVIPPVNPKTLKWLPWCWYYIIAISSTTLFLADKCGEKLAWILGITSPKYQQAIDEYYRLKKEEEEEDEEAAAVAMVESNMTGVTISEPIAMVEACQSPVHPPVSVVTDHSIPMHSPLI